MPLLPGQVLDNRYRIIELLGEGGFGAVYKAWDINLNGPCAVKENFGVTLESATQFLREASLLFNLKHANLPKVSNVFSIPGQGQYLVMEYIEGEDMETLRKQAGGRLSEAQVLPWITQVCDALSYTHSRTPPIIHRDIKPANIRITPESQAILVDFGIAKIFDPVKGTPTAARGYTPYYAPFEQYGVGSTDARTDIYALGVTLYHLLTGQLPPESIDRVRRDALVAPRQLNPAISPRVEAAILRAMAVMPEKRWQSVAEFKAKISEKSIVKKRPVQIPWRWLGALGSLVVAILVLWAVFIGGGGKTDNLSATQTALAQAIVQVTEDVQPTKTLTTETPPTERPTPNKTFTPRPPTATPTKIALLERITDAQGVKMALIPAGEFQMGSQDGQANEKPVHRVYLNAFNLDIYEVTNALYMACVQADACEKPDGIRYGNSQYDNYPVTNVDWNRAQVYCSWRGGALPSEAQWEKAARGGLNGKKYPWGDESPVCKAGAKNGANFWGCGQSIDIGKYAPNGYGLYDMAGNVWEWVQDWYQSDYYSSQSVFNNPFGPSTGQARVLRGGGWGYESSTVPITYRYGYTPSYSDPYVGFRCARTP